MTLLAVSLALVATAALAALHELLWWFLVRVGLADDSPDGGWAPPPADLPGLPALAARAAATAARDGTLEGP